jgi:sigma-E factor negative regulatory protein RseA
MNPPAQPRELSAEERCALMSSLVDGEATAVPGGCALWRDDAEARATWHAYHLIGDVLRSDDLAVSARRDIAFLAGVRARLAAEPTVLAPEPALAPALAPAVGLGAVRAVRRHAWLAPAAVAAGFVAVAGVLVVARVAGPAADSPVLAAVQAPNTGLSFASSSATGTQPLVVEGRLIRDARLDSYFRAHREALGGVPAAVPGGWPRSIETLAPMPVTAVKPVTPVSATVER